MVSRNDAPHLPPYWVRPAAGKPDREVRPVITVSRRKPPSGGSPTDPHFANVVLLHHAATLTPESSSAARTITALGSTPPSISATGGYNDGSSILFPNVTGSRLTVPSSSDFAFGTGDFTVEGLVNLTGFNQYSALLEIGNHGLTTGIIFLVGTDSTAKAYSGAFVGGGGSMGVTLNQLTYVAWVRRSGVLSVYRDTTRLSSAPFTNNLTNSNTITIGSDSSGGSIYLLNGKVDELRVTRQVAREYLSGPTITLPPLPFPDA
jgi:hypothetical protein